LRRNISSLYNLEKCNHLRAHAARISIRGICDARPAWITTWTTVLARVFHVVVIVSVSRVRYEMQRATSASASNTLIERELRRTRHRPDRSSPCPAVASCLISARLGSARLGAVAGSRCRRLVLAGARSADTRRRFGRMAALSTREPRSVCVSRGAFVVAVTVASSSPRSPVSHVGRPQLIPFANPSRPTRRPCRRDPPPPRPISLALSHSHSPSLSREQEEEATTAAAVAASASVELVSLGRHASVCQCAWAVRCVPQRRRRRGRSLGSPVPSHGRHLPALRRFLPVRVTPKRRRRRRRRRFSTYVSGVRSLEYYAPFPPRVFTIVASSLYRRLARLSPARLRLPGARTGVSWKQRGGEREREREREREPTPGRLCDITSGHDGPSRILPRKRALHCLESRRCRLRRRRAPEYVRTYRAAVGVPIPSFRSRVRACNVHVCVCVCVWEHEARKIVYAYDGLQHALVSRMTFVLGG